MVKCKDCEWFHLRHSRIENVCAVNYEFVKYIKDYDKERECEDFTPLNYSHILKEKLNEAEE